MGHWYWNLRILFVTVSMHGESNTYKKIFDGHILGRSSFLWMSKFQRRIREVALGPSQLLPPWRKYRKDA